MVRHPHRNHFVLQFRQIPTGGGGTMAVAPTPATADAAGQADDLLRLELQLCEARTELDAVKEELRDKTPWYRQMSGIISVLAFALSMLSSLYSCQRDLDEEKQQARASLNVLSQRLLALPKENFELLQKYKDDVNALSNLPPLLNTENITLINSMKELVSKFPGVATDSDKFVLASALWNSWRVPEAMAIYSDLADRATDPNVTVASLRNLGIYYLAKGRENEGRATFEKAIGMFASKFKNEDPITKTSFNRYTYLGWAGAEVAQHHCDAAAEALAKAAELIEGTPTAPNDIMLQMATQIERDIQRCRSGQPVSQSPLRAQ